MSKTGSITQNRNIIQSDFKPQQATQTNWKVQTGVKRANNGLNMGSNSHKRQKPVNTKPKKP